jgi:hypothetical protein
MIYNGDTASGIRVWDASHFGWTVNDFNAAPGWTQPLALVDPDLVICAAGRNDWGNGATAARFTSIYGDHLDIVALQAPKASILCVIEHETTPGSSVV